jgi:hypothetical protein
VILSLAGLGVGGVTQDVIDGPLGDYGDAPDSLSAGYARVNPDLSAFFPTLFGQQSTPENPDYVLHRFPTEGF